MLILYYCILLYIYYTFIDALKFRWWTSTALVLFEKSHQKHHGGPKLGTFEHRVTWWRYYWQHMCPCIKKSSKKKRAEADPVDGSSRPSLSSSSARPWHDPPTPSPHMMCLFSPTTSTCHLSLSEHQTSYITPILESRWFNSPSISPPQSVALVHVQTLHRHPWRWWIPMAVPMTRVHLSGTKRRSCSGIRSWHGLESRRSWCCVEMSTQYMGEKNGWTQALESLNLSWFSRLPF